MTKTNHKPALREKFTTQHHTPSDGRV